MKQSILKRGEKTFRSRHTWELNVLSKARNLMVFCDTKVAKVELGGKTMFVICEKRKILLN